MHDFTYIHNPHDAVGYNNVVILCGINDIKSRYISERRNIDFVYEKLKLKVRQIRAICKGINVVICPILPTRLPELNKKARYFNQFIWNDLVPNDWGVSYVWGFDEFLDNKGNLSSNFAKPNDHLHLNRRGASVLGKLIKTHFFPNPVRNFVGTRPYSDAVSGANVCVAERHSAPPT